MLVSQIIQLSSSDRNIAISTATGDKIMEIGKGGDLRLGGGGENGDVFVKNASGKDIIWISGRTGGIHIGANNQAGHLSVNNADGKEVVHINGEERNFVIKSTRGNPIVKLDKWANLTLGGDGVEGDVILRDRDGNEVVHLDAEQRNFVMKSPKGDTIVELGKYGNLSLGGGGLDGDVIVKNKDGKDTIHLDGDAGDIILKNADCAEDFDISETETVDPGTVMVLNQEGKLGPSMVAYDKKVAGVISGAGDCKPGIILDKQDLESNRMPVALMGKVYCKVDAEYSPIEVGDLLTTSLTRGYAMKANDPFKAFGAVIGKALRPLQTGRGLIPIIVALQ